MMDVIHPDALMIVPAAILFLIVHAAKVIRLYLILIDEKIPFRRFLFLYCLTTLVNLIVPFKLGEFFRIFVFCKATKSFRIGFLSVLLDRFFDTVALVLILLPFELLQGRVVSSSTLLLTVFVVVAVFAYLAFSSFYTYLNRYLIMNRTSTGAMGSLKLLELAKAGYEYVKRLIHGRYALLTIFSFVAWLLECAILYLLAGCYHLSGQTDISAYIQSIVSAAHTELMDRYILFGTYFMAALSVVTLILCLSTHTLFDRSGRKENQA
ncbi:MAG: flippase-like domain-containing protein [Lachnospiraceae bacterium]|nr:flippase-like domain-containing protein [Lachnospiraceae bacterium]